MNKTKLLDSTNSPTCLHVLGQDLVNALWLEGQALKRKLEVITEQADAQFSAGDTHATFNKQTIDSIRE